MKLSNFMAGSFGIIGFVISIIAGLYADNGFNSILLHAILAAVVCYIIGYIAGAIAQFTADEHGRHIADKVAQADAEKSALAAQKQADAQAELAANAPVAQALGSAE